MIYLVHQNDQKMGREGNIQHAFKSSYNWHVNQD